MKERAKRLRERAQVASETRGRAEHPDHPEDPLEEVFHAANAWNMNPVDVLKMDNEVYTLYLAWTVGRGLGEAEAVKRV